LWHVAVKAKVATGISLANSLFLVLTSKSKRDGSNRANGSNLTTLDGKRLFLGSSNTGAPASVTNRMAE
jgi:hypothetical protein